MLRNGVYEVEQIIGRKCMNRRVLYLVRWKGFSSDHDSWEPSNNLGACKLLIKNYNEEHDAEIDSHVANSISTNKKRSHPEHTSSRLSEKGPAAKKLKLAKNDLRLKLDGNKITKANSESIGKNVSTTIDSLNETPQVANLKKKKDKHPNKLKNFKSKIQILEKSDPHQSGDNLVVNENGEIAKRFNGISSSSDVKKYKGKKGLSKNNDKVKLLARIPANKINAILKHQVGSEQSKKRIEQLRQLIELQKHKVDSSSSSDSNRHSRQKGDNTNKLNKSGARIKSKAKYDVSSTQINVTNPDTEKTSEPETVDLTKSPSDSTTFFTPNESIEISDEEEEDGEDVLYSLNPECDEDNESGSSKRDSTGSKSSSVIEISDVTSKAQGIVDGSSTKTKKKKGASLLDPKQKDKIWTDKSDEPMRPVSPPPPPHFTTVKEPSGSPDNPDPSKPSGPDPVSPEASETYLADVPTSFSVTSAGSVLDEDDQPLSPGSMSYKSFLDNLPDQLLQGVKRGGKKGGKGTTTARSGISVLGNLVSSTTTTTSSSISSGLGGAVERRASVRASECAFRYKQIVVKKCFHFTQIWLNTQTPMKNALNPAVIQELISAMNSAKYDDSHLVLFSGFGPVFCSGTDLHYLVTGDRRLAARQMVERIRELTKTFISFPKPIIAAISGAAVGLGVSLLLLCDVVYASDKASFHLPYSQLSQTPEGCSSFTLPNTLGLPSANELLFGGRKITAMEAYQLGLVSQVFWPTLMMQEVIPRAQVMAASSAKALEATKLLIRSHYRTKMELTNETECNLLLERWLSVDCQHAIEAYIANEKNWAF